jgi:hypothetical protein
MTPQQILELACHFFDGTIFKAKYTDLGPFEQLSMKTTSFEHAGQNLWLDRGNAAKSSETKYELCRNSRSVTKTESEYLKCLEPLRVCNGWKIIGWILNIPSNKTMLQVSYIILFIYALSILLIFLWSAQFNLLINYVRNKIE